MSSVPEPTEAMVEALALAEYGERAAADPTVLAESRDLLKAAIAAAPPEWLLRAALTEDEIALVRLRLFGAEGVQNVDHRNRKTLDKFSRALRGGEDMLREDAANVTRQVSGRRPRGLRGGEET